MIIKTAFDGNVYLPLSDDLVDKAEDSTLVTWTINDIKRNAVTLMATQKRRTQMVPFDQDGKRDPNEAEIAYYLAYGMVHVKGWTNDAGASNDMEKPEDNILELPYELLVYYVNKVNSVDVDKIQKKVPSTTSTD